MASGSMKRFTLILVAAAIVSFAAYQAKAVFAPLTLGLFLIAILWPVQNWLKQKIPALLALAITVTATILVALGFASLIVWGFTRVGQSLIADTARYQSIYDAAVTWLDRHGFSVASLWADNVNVSRLLGLAQRVTSRLNTTLSFWLITLLYVILGLMEVDDLRRKVEIIIEPGTARNILSASSEAARKLRKYLRVRTQMSVMTGVLVGLFAWAVGLQFPMEWAVIAFTLNYIPFIGPFVATLLPTVLEMAHATTWQSVVGIFVCLNIIQFAVGSYIEPRLAGAVLSISPTVVLFTTFFWAYIWGIYGAFIGVPLTIAILTFCDHFASTHWIAQLFGGPLDTKDRPSTS
jgi:AI-2 transport protein TqsA